MSASIAPTKAAKVPESGAADAPDATETAQTCTEKAAPASVAQNGAEHWKDPVWLGLGPTGRCDSGQPLLDLLALDKRRGGE